MSDKWRFRIRSILFTVLTLVLSGCGAMRPELPVVSQADLSSNGLLIGSFSREKTGYYYHMYTLFFRPKNDKKNYYYIHVKPLEKLTRNEFQDDFSDDRTGGVLYAFLLPEGDYEFYHYSLFENYGTYQRTTHPRQPFSIPFSIKAGEIHYVGEIKCIAEGYQTIIGLKEPANPFFVISDQSPRDVPLFKAKYPTLNWSKLNVVILSPAIGNENIKSHETMPAIIIPPR